LLTAAAVIANVIWLEAFMKQLGRIVLTFVAGILGLVVGAALSALAVFVCCWLLSRFYTQPGTGGMIFYVGSFGALVAAGYGGWHGLLFAVKYAVSVLFRSPSIPVDDAR
jgi:hypothetical protein